MLIEIIIFIITLIIIIKLRARHESELDQLEKLRNAAEYASVYGAKGFSTLQSILRQDDSEGNPDPEKTFQEGCNYLNNANTLVEVYKNYISASIDKESIKLVINMLIILEFDPKRKGQGKNYYKLLHSDRKEDVRAFLQLVEQNIEIPLKKFLESIKHRLCSILYENLLKSIKNDNLLAVKNLIAKGVNVNTKDSDGWAPLHHAVNRGNIDIVKTILKESAEAVQTTTKSGSALHIACSKGYTHVLEVLLRDKLNYAIDDKITSDGTTPLHVAAKNGFLEVVKCLLVHGATYNIENKEGKTPVNLSIDEKVTIFLNLVEKLFGEAKEGNVEGISKVKPDELLAIINARNNQGKTLNQLKSLKDDENALKNLVYAANLHLNCSKLYIPKLRNMSQKIPFESDKNNAPWISLKEGSYYLGNAYNLVKIYKVYKPGSIDNKDMQSINDTLETLQFDRKHITFEKIGNTTIFASNGQGTNYYRLLHSESNQDVRSFIDMVKLGIDIPVQRFLESIKEKLIIPQGSNT